MRRVTTGCRWHERVVMSAVMTLWLLAAPASAQDPMAEVAGGFTILHDQTVEETSTWGWMVSPAVHLNRWFSVVGDVGGNYKTVNRFAVSETAILVGPRASWRWSSGALYFQMLFGRDRSNYDGTVFSGGALQSGIGVDLNVAERWAVRFESGGRVQFIDDDSYSFWRGTFGAVYRFNR